MPKSEKNSTTEGKTSKGLLTKQYSLILQEKYGNQASRLTTKRNTRKIPMSKKRIAQFADVTAEIERGMTTATAQVMDYINSVFTMGSNQNSGQVEFTVDDYMTDSQLASTRTAKAKLKKALDDLLGVTLHFNGGPVTGAMHIYAEYKIKRGGHVTITLAPTYHKFLSSSFPMPMPILLFQLNPQSQATSWYILRTLAENKRMNYGRPSADRLKVKYILAKCPSLPAYKEIADEGHVSRKIMEPFFKALEPLTKAIDYTFIGPDGQPLNYQEGLDYDTFANSIFAVKKWRNYPDDYMISYTKTRKAKQQHKKK